MGDPDNKLPISEEAMEQIYAWVDGIPLTRPKRNIARDFSDGVMAAELVKHFFPKIVELHNYSTANSVQHKLYNWNTLNQKVFKRLNFALSKAEIDAVCNCTPGAVERVLLTLKSKIEAKIAHKNSKHAAENDSSTSPQMLHHLPPQQQQFQQLQQQQQIQQQIQQQQQLLQQLQLSQQQPNMYPPNGTLTQQPIPSNSPMKPVQSASKLSPQFPHQQMTPQQLQHLQQLQLQQQMQNLQLQTPQQPPQQSQQFSQQPYSQQAYSQTPQQPYSQQAYSQTPQQQVPTKQQLISPNVPPNYNPTFFDPTRFQSPSGNVQQQEQDYLLVIEKKDQTIKELQAHIDNLQSRIMKLEQIAKIRDSKIQKLTQKLQQAGLA